MSVKHEVTVYDRMPATVRVALIQMDAYLRRAEWTKFEDVQQGMVEWVLGDASVWVPQQESFKDWARHASAAIWEVAFYEQRQPSAVLADIAKEPA